MERSSSALCAILDTAGGIMPESRKIAAIVAADVVGYSRLAGADEDRTLARLRTLRSDLIDPTIAVHKGRAVKRTGDGILIEFRSVVDAVRCAMAERRVEAVRQHDGLSASGWMTREHLQHAESQRLFRGRQETGVAQDCVVRLVGLEIAAKRLCRSG
jgi:class 3 adenylate cyclase